MGSLRRTKGCRQSQAANTYMHRTPTNPPAETYKPADARHMLLSRGLSSRLRG
jgi:hypothetical protein